MNISPWTLYWINRLDTATHILIAITIICLVACFITFLILNDTHYSGDPVKFPVKTFSILIPLAVISILTNCFLPSTKEMYALYTIPKVINHPKIQETIKTIPDITADTMKMTHKWIKDKLNETVK
jgi:hypothetical protein